MQVRGYVRTRCAHRHRYVCVPKQIGFDGCTCDRTTHLSGTSENEKAISSLVHVNPKRAPWTSTCTLACTLHKELKTRSCKQNGASFLLIGYMLSQRLRLIGQAITSDAAYSAALHKAWFLACIANVAAHTHSSAPPQQLSKPGLWHVSPSLQLIRTP